MQVNWQLAQVLQLILKSRGRIARNIQQPVSYPAARSHWLSKQLEQVVSSSSTHVLKNVWQHSLYVLKMKRFQDIYERKLIWNNLSGSCDGRIYQIIFNGPSNNGYFIKQTLKQQRTKMKKVWVCMWANILYPAGLCLEVCALSTFSWSACLMALSCIWSIMTRKYLNCTNISQQSIVHDTIIGGGTEQKLGWLTHAVRKAQRENFAY